MSDEVLTLETLQRAKDAAYRIPPFSGRGRGTKDNPFNLVLSNSVEPWLEKEGITEGDVIQPMGTFGGWWRVVYSRHIPQPVEVR